MNEETPNLPSRWFVLLALATLAGFVPTAFLFWPLTYTEYNQSGSLLQWAGTIGVASAAVVDQW